MLLSKPTDLPDALSLLHAGPGEGRPWLIHWHLAEKKMGQRWEKHLLQVMGKKKVL